MAERRLKVLPGTEYCHRIDSHKACVLYIPWLWLWHNLYNSPAVPACCPSSADYAFSCPWSAQPLAVLLAFEARDFHAMPCHSHLLAEAPWHQSACLQALALLPWAFPGGPIGQEPAAVQQRQDSCQFGKQSNVLSDSAFLLPALQGERPLMHVCSHLDADNDCSMRLSTSLRA